MTFTVSGNDLAAQITTDRTDVEFSFDGTDWGQTKSAGVGHNEKVTARIRYAETDDYNASPAVSKTWNSGHGPLNRHDRVEPTCQAEGSIEYWTCDVCGLYFASADGSKSITATEIVLPKTDHSWAEGYLSDMTGHWHKCGVCGITSNTESIHPVARPPQNGRRSVPSAVMRSHRRSLLPVTTMTMMTTMTAVRRPIRTRRPRARQHLPQPRQRLPHPVW